MVQRGTLLAIKEEEQFNDNLELHSELIFASKFKNYLDFESRFAAKRCCNGSLGGAGWSLDNGVAVYCLNTALCSFGGLKDHQGHTISDQGLLMIDTRHLHSWLEENKSDVRILVMHHPLDWLAPWAKAELEIIIHSSFRCVFSGHIHEALPEFHTRGNGGSLFLSAPPLFTHKKDRLGYSITTLDSQSPKIDLAYREWSPSTANFVAGATLAGRDDGHVVFSSGVTGEPSILSPSPNTLSVLTEEFEAALKFYSVKKNTWVDRDFSRAAETVLGDNTEIVIPQKDLISGVKECVVRAPRQYGLTCLGKKLALDHHNNSKSGKVIITIDASDFPHTQEELPNALELRCRQLKISRAQIEGFVIDNWTPTKRGRKLLSGIKSQHPQSILIILHGFDDCTQIAESFGDTESDPTGSFERFYLLALDRTRIRELAVKYLDGASHLDDELVIRRVINDIDSLNIHRTPLNCLLLLKLAEQGFDENPINRTEVIGRVLSLLFFQFNKIPTYASRPDLKDCEYALGYLSEWLIREQKRSFSKIQFDEKIREYCKKQLLELDVDVLLAFLISENLFVKKGEFLEFRFAYWLHYFSAHRMHHDASFASFILSDKRYSAFPEILEFYAGIDRRRTDAIEILTSDLRQMIEEFSKRTSIPPDFNPFKDAEWAPDAAALEALRKEVEEGVTASAIPVSVKDAIADANYNSAKPYNQELSKFMEESTLRQMVSAMRGASRALRNSDHVAPSAKSALLTEVMNCWTRVAQILVVLSPVLAEEKSVRFEGINWILGKGFEQLTSTEKRWQVIMTLVTTNIVGWYQEDIFSSKLGPLFSDHIAKNPRSLSELFLLMTMAVQRPHGWEAEIEKLIVRERKDSFYLNRVFGALRSEYKFGTMNERSRQQLRRLAGMAVAKHHTGQRHPDFKLVQRVADQILDGKTAKENKFF